VGAEKANSLPFGKGRVPDEKAKEFSRDGEELEERGGGRGRKRRSERRADSLHQER